jgi:signal transduction histidine kinase
MTVSSTVGASTTARETPAAGPTGTGPGPGRHTSRKPRRVLRRPIRLSVSRRLSLSNWPVSARLVAVFIAASVTGLVFGGLRVADAVGTAGGYARTTQLAVLGKQITQLAQDMESERDRTVGVAAVTTLQQNAAADNAGPAVTASLQQALGTAQGQLAGAQAATDKDVASVQQLAQHVLSDPAFPVSVRNGANGVLAQIGDRGLVGIRLQVLGQAPPAVIQDYSGTLSALYALNAQMAGSSGDAVLSNEVNALGALSQAKDQASQQRAILDAAFIESGLNDAGGKAAKGGPAVAAFNDVGGLAALNYAGGLQPLVTAQDIQATDLATFQAAATEAESEAFLIGQTGSQVAAAGNIYTAVTFNNGNLQAIFPQLNKIIPGLAPATAPALWYADQSAVVDGMHAAESQIATEIVARSQVLQHQAFESALVTSLVTVVVILLVLGVTTLVARTLVNPLRRLQSDALEIATVRLPARVAAAAAGTDADEATTAVEPIGVQSTDEIGRVARAFDQVHAEAVRLAGTEAQLRGSLNAMFISLSRRSVPLIERLARMIDGMEQNEDDPDQLAKLFSMDHLVTRMRRNSENLLVLAGEEPVRKWTESVPLSDVVRAAASEIEQYNRVALAVQPGIMISGQAAADVVHLLAELIENATMFSPQNSQVRVTVMELSSGGVLVEVRDDGVGVSPNRLADMNWRLDHPPMVDVSISRHMGLYAVSRLAARHGIRVKLRPGSPQGLSALVWLPSTLAKREPTLASGGHSRAFGADATGPVPGTRPAAPAGQVTGRHRSALSTSGEQPLTARRGGQAGRSTAWFAAKRPSSGAAVSSEELSVGWQSTTNGSAADSGRRAPEFTERTAEPAAQTTAGLPRRVPRTSAYPGSDTPGGGMTARMAPAAPAAPADAAAQVLAAPLDGTAPQGVRYQEASHQEQLPSRRRSPEAARSRLTGFQLGSRDAAQTGHAKGLEPHAGEENSR